VTRSQTPGDLSGFGYGGCLQASTNRRCDHSRPGKAYWVLSQLPLCSPSGDIYAESLLKLGKPKGTPGRIALPVAGDDY
jgi:hypothetical protein